jgi:MarR-like DNA-binding transcriptional regulator SgrR of sgrS sRNA
MGVMVRNQASPSQKVNLMSKKSQAQVTTNVAVIEAPTPYAYDPLAFTRPLASFGVNPLSNEEKAALREQYEQEKIENEAIAKALALVAAKKSVTSTKKVQAYTQVKIKADQKISILAATTCRPGTKGASYFNLLADDMTVSQAMKAGVPRGYVQWFVAHGSITVN